MCASEICLKLAAVTIVMKILKFEYKIILSLFAYDSPLPTTVKLTHSLTAARNRLWVVAPSMLTGHQQEPMRQQQ